MTKISTSPSATTPASSVFEEHVSSTLNDNSYHVTNVQHEKHSHNILQCMSAVKKGNINIF